MNLSDIPQQLARYGYTITAQNEIVTRGGKTTGVKVEVKKGRMRAFNSHGLLWSGSDIGKFLEKYWYAQPLQETKL